VLLADGINSPLASKTGFRPEPKPHQVALAVKEVIELSEGQIQERFNVEPGNGVTIEIIGEVTKGMNGVSVIYTNRKFYPSVSGQIYPIWPNIKSSPTR